MRIRKAVIPAAGFGTRFLPMTKATAKEMLNIVDKPAIQYVVEEAVASGIEEILIVTMRHKTAMENHFDASPELKAYLMTKGQKNLVDQCEAIENMAQIYYVRQKQMNGLGAAVLEAKAFVGHEPFAVLLSDDIIDGSVPCLQQLIKVHEETKASVIGVQSVAQTDLEKYGILDLSPLGNKRYEVKDLIEKPLPNQAPSNMAVMGRYILSPSIFNILETLQPGMNQEIQLTDALRALVHIEPMYALDFEGVRFDTGDKLGYMKACVNYGLKHPEIQDEFLDYLKTMVKT